jgi:CID domain
MPSHHHDSNKNSLIIALKQVDGSQIGIQRAASAMMKQYDNGSAMAVTEWRNTLQTCHHEQILPLLYVCNEVLQTSKRNRGNKFLESFSPYLQSSLIYMVQQFNSIDVTEKIRRVIKIWGNRQVFSIRYVNELLIGLEPYRKNNSTTTTTNNASTSSNGTVTGTHTNDSMTNSSVQSPENTTTNSIAAVDKAGNGNDDDDNENDNDDIMELLDGPNNNSRGANKNDTTNSNDDDDDDDDTFGDASQRSDQLNIELNNDMMKGGDDINNKHRRRRRSGDNDDNTSTGPKKRRNSSSNENNNTGQQQQGTAIMKVSMSHFMDLFHRLIQLQQKFDMAMLTIRRVRNSISTKNMDSNSNNSINNSSNNTIDTKNDSTTIISNSDPIITSNDGIIGNVENDTHNDDDKKNNNNDEREIVKMNEINNSTNDTNDSNIDDDANNVDDANNDDNDDDDDITGLENLVGDELQAMKRKNDNDMKIICEQRVILYQTAIEQHVIEETIIQQYIPWFEIALQQDDTDILFCQTLLKTIQQFQPIHSQILLAYQHRMKEQHDQQRLAYEIQRKKQEQEENERFRRAALAKETEAKPGMVWNPTTREYQSLNTDESWRD